MRTSKPLLAPQAAAGPGTGGLRDGLELRHHVCAERLHEAPGGGPRQRPRGPTPLRRTGGREKQCLVYTRRLLRQHVFFKYLQ